MKALCNMIQTDKSIVIITHPRSGSNWFCDSLKMYSMAELFNLTIHYRYLPYTKIATYNHPMPADKSTELQKRIQRFYQMEVMKGKMSVKIHTNHYEPELLPFLQNPDFNIIDLRRRDMYAVFMSYAIATVTGEFKGEITIPEITISRQVFESVHYWLATAKKINMYLHSILPQIKTVYYEDCLQWPESAWWTKDVKIPIQDAKNKTTIINIDEVNQWMASIDWRDLFPPDHESLVLP